MIMTIIDLASDSRWNLEDPFVVALMLEASSLVDLVFGSPPCALRYSQCSEVCHDLPWPASFALSLVFLGRQG